VRALALVMLVGCTQPRSERCQQVCTRENECISQTSSQIPFDEKECIAACAVLESDQENSGKVVDHANCVTHAASCSGVLECK